MLGLAIGDALGKRTEFLNLDEIGRLSPDWRDLPLPEKALVTDDTQMTLALARALRDALAEGPLGPLRLELPLREEFVDWWRSPANNRAPGMTCLRSCFRPHDQVAVGRLPPMGIHSRMGRFDRDGNQLRLRWRHPTDQLIWPGLRSQEGGDSACLGPRPAVAYSG